MKLIKLPYKLLIYDIETHLALKARIWRLGEQGIRHEQLDVAHCTNDIICIAYKFYGDKKTEVISGPNLITEFDRVVKQADVTIGKNNDRFDVKHINAQRMLQGLAPYPEWTQTSEDLEKQLRKHFAFPSQSLDYISKLLGFGGKQKMEWLDWIKIGDLKEITKFVTTKKFTSAQLNTISQTLFLKPLVQVINDGTKALTKMKKYNKKDVEDTEAVLQRVLPYIKLRHNASEDIYPKNTLACSTCGSKHMVATKIITAGMTKYQQFYCNTHDGYGGRSTFKYDKNRHKVYGRIQ